MTDFFYNLQNIFLIYLFSTSLFTFPTSNPINTKRDTRVSGLFTPVYRLLFHFLVRMDPVPKCFGVSVRRKKSKEKTSSCFRTLPSQLLLYYYTVGTQKPGSGCFYDDGERRGMYPVGVEKVLDRSHRPTLGYDLN